MPEWKPNKFDTDYSFNLVLAPNFYGATQAQVEATFQGNLVAEQPDIKSHNLASPTRW